MRSFNTKYLWTFVVLFLALLALGCTKESSGDSTSFTENGDGESDQTESSGADYYGEAIYDDSATPAVAEASVPFIYYDNGTYYLYMCRGEQGHHVSMSTDGVTFGTPQATGIGGCGLNFVPLNDGGYRLYTTAKAATDEGMETIECRSAVFSDLTDLGPSSRVEDSGIRFGSAGEPCNDFFGTPSVIRLNSDDDSVRVYLSCGSPSSMASFTSASDGLTFSDSDGILIEQAIDAEIHRVGDGFRVFYTLMNPDVHLDVRPFKPQEIMTAVSDDGINWLSEGMIANVESVSRGINKEVSVVADPSAILLEDGSWRVFFGTTSEKDELGDIYSFRFKPQ